LTQRAHIEKLRKDSDFVDSIMDRIKSNPGPLKTPCWEWQGGLDKSGYGRIHVKRYCERKTGRNFFVHRLVYMINKGYITSEEFILHQCHNRLCCNPSHFKIGDHNDNMDDLSKSGRVSGENNHRSLLSEENVMDILDLYYNGDDEGNVWTINELIEEFEVSKGTITDVIYGRTWQGIYNEFMED
jgi:hypothetical protein